MGRLPSEVLEVLEGRSCCSDHWRADGKPNSVYVTCIALCDETLVVIAECCLSKTKENIEPGSLVSVLFIKNEGKAYQIKGEVAYHKTGRYYVFIKAWNPKEHPAHGAVMIIPGCLY